MDKTIRRYTDFAEMKAEYRYWQRMSGLAFSRAAMRQWQQTDRVFEGSRSNCIISMIKYDQFKQEVDQWPGSNV